MPNFSGRNYPEYRIGFPRPGPWWVRLNSDARVYSDGFGDAPGAPVHATQAAMHSMSNSGTLGVGPYSALIFSQ